MTYALIGCGRISPNHIMAALKNNLNIVAVCDICKENAENTVNLFKLENCKIYTDYKKLVDEVKPELIAIATESGAHAEIALYCIENGINLMIEKPIAMSLEDADKIVALSKEKGVVVSACHQNRFNIAVQQLHNVITSGRFGKISHGSINVRWNRGESYYKQASWRGTWEKDGGALMNQCIHGLDLLRWCLGNEITEVYGYTDRKFHDYIEAEDIGVAVVKFKSGALATIEGTTNIMPHDLEETLSIFGENGMVKLGGIAANKVEVWDFIDHSEADTEKKKIEEVSPNVYGNGHASLYKDVINAVENHCDPYVTAEDGRRALELVLAIYKSAYEGKPVSLPLKKCSSVDFSGRFDA